MIDIRKTPNEKNQVATLIAQQQINLVAIFSAPSAYELTVMHELQTTKNQSHVGIMNKKCNI